MQTPVVKPKAEDQKVPVVATSSKKKASTKKTAKSPAKKAPAKKAVAPKKVTESSEKKKGRPTRGYPGKLTAYEYLRDTLQKKAMTRPECADALNAYWEAPKIKHPQHKSTSNQLFVDFQNWKYAGGRLAKEGLIAVKDAESGKLSIRAMKPAEKKAYEEFVAESKSEKKAKKEESKAKDK